MPKLRICIPVLVALLSLTAAMTAAASEDLKIVYNVGEAPLKFEDADSRTARQSDHRIQVLVRGRREIVHRIHLACP